MSFPHRLRHLLIEKAIAVLSAENFLIAADRQAWVNYRNALQDMDTTGENPIFPTAPPEPVFPLDATQVTQRSRKDSAHNTANNIPNWAGWSQAQFQNWWNENLADSIVDGFSIPANIKTMLKSQNAAILRIGQMEIALRDEIWPDLSDP